jgi:hypothetical protein
MTKTKKSTIPPPQHRDLLGHVIALDDYVVYPSHNTLVVGRVAKLNAKMIGISDVSRRAYHGYTNKYPDDVTVVEGARVTWYLLKHAGA